MTSNKLIAIVLAVVALLIGAGSMSSDSSSLSPPLLPNAGWQEVGTGSATGGGISHNNGFSGAASIAIAPDGAPYIAWNDDSSGNFEIYVRKWNGSSWVEVGVSSASGGGISNNNGTSRHATIAVSPDNTPYVAWQDNTSGHDQIYVRRWNGNVWEEVGAGSASGGGVSNTTCFSYSGSNTLAIAPNGTAYVIWHDDCGSPEIYVRRWNGSSWEEAGGSASGGGISNTPSSYSYDPSIAVAPDNVPYAVWYDDGRGNTDYDIYARRFTNNSWEEVGTGSASGAGIISPPSDWSDLPRVAIAMDGTPYITWSDRASGNRQIYVRLWDGNSWEEVGAGSASGGGISNTGGFSGSSSIAITPGGTPYIAWYDDTSGDSEIYVRRWNGSSWEEVGAGSASGGGISDNSGNSFASASSIAIASDGTPYVAWTDDSSGDYEIYVRRFGPLNSDPIADAGDAYTVAEGDSVQLDGSGSYDPDPGDTLTYKWDLDNDGAFETSGLTPTFSATGYDGPSQQPITLQVCDNHDACTTDTTIINISNVAPTVDPISAVSDPVKVGTTTNVGANFSDPGTPDTHTAVWDWGDGTTPGTVNEDNGSGSVNDSHIYTKPGVYTVKLTVTDDDGDAGESIYQFVVVYDPDDGFVTGGGWIDSPEGACQLTELCMAATGKANFGFVSKYKKGATVPTGQTEFQFKAGNLNFHSDIYEWLVVAGPHAKFKGTGTINGGGAYGFMVTATDSDINGGGDVDGFRIKIVADDEVVYDNKMGASDDSNETTDIGGGSIVIHDK